MLCIILLFVTKSASEWVEISQTYHVPTRFKQDERLSDTMVYRNQTLVSPWNKGIVNKVPHVGNVRKVNYASVKTSSRPHRYQDETSPKHHHDKDSNYNIRRTTTFESNGKVILKTENSNKNSTMLKNSELEEMITENYVHGFSTKATHISTNFEKTTIRTIHKVKSNPNQSTRRIYINQIKTPSQSGAEITLRSTTEILTTENIVLESTAQIYSEHDVNEKTFNGSQNVHSHAQEYDKQEDAKNENIASSENKMEGMWKAVKVVAETIAKHSRKTLTGKLKYLGDLKDTIIYSIENQIDRVWPDEGRRSARSAEHHVEIPSSESALMTISFLTFAVFLIKLVLVIHTYKQKAMMVTPTVFAVSRAAAGLKRHH